MPAALNTALVAAAVLAAACAVAAQAASSTGEIAVSARVEARCTARATGPAADGRAAVILTCNSADARSAPLIRVDAGRGAAAVRHDLRPSARAAGPGMTYRGAFDWPPTAVSLSRDGAVPVVTITYGGVQGP